MVRSEQFDEDFAIAYHTHFGTGTLFNSIDTGTKILNFSHQGIVTCLKRPDFFLPCSDLLFELLNTQPTALTPPQGVLDECRKGNQNEKKQTHSDTHERLPCETAAGYVSAQIVESIAPGVRSHFGQLFFDAQQLVVLGHAVRTRQGARFDLHCIGCNCNVGNGGVFGFA